MDLKRWVLATVGAFGVIATSDFVIHNLWLGEMYRANAQWWRSPEEMGLLNGYMIAGEVALAGLLAFVYSKGYEVGKGTVSQGFRFGVLMGLLLYLPKSFMQHFVYPYPLGLILNWLIGGIAQVALAGLMIGYIYKPSKSS